MTISATARDLYERERASRRMQSRRATGRESNRSFAVYEKLRAAVRLGLIGEGVQLREDELVETFGTGRAAVRSALARLVQDGLIERGRRRGTVITDLAAYSLPDGEADFLITDHVVDGSNTDRGGNALQRKVVTHRQCLADPVVATVFGAQAVHVTEFQVLLESRPVEYVTEYRCEVSESARARESRALYAGVFGSDPMVQFPDEPTGGALEREVVVYATLADADLAKVLGVAEASAVLVEESTIRRSDGRVLSLSVTRRPGVSSTSVVVSGDHRNSLPSISIG